MGGQSFRRSRSSGSCVRWMCWSAGKRRRLKPAAISVASRRYREPRTAPIDVGQLPMARSLGHACMLTLGLLTHFVKHTKFSIGVSLLG